MNGKTKKYDSSRDCIAHFFSGRLYVLIAAILVFWGHTLAWELAVAAVMALSVLLGGFFCDDLRFFLPPLLFTILLIPVSHTPYLPTESDYYATAWRPYAIALLAALVLVGLAAFLIRNRRAARAAAHPKLLFGFAALFVSPLLWGLGTDYAPRNLFYGLGIGASFFVVYLLFSFFHPKTRTNAEHFLFVLMTTGLLVAAELLVLYLTDVRFDGLVPVKETVLIGWGTWTHIGAFSVICLPASLYFARKSKRWPLYLLASLLTLSAMLMSASRGAWLYGAVIFLLCLFLLVLGGRKRVLYRVIAAVGLLLGLLLAIFLLPRLWPSISAFFGGGLGDNGRFSHWQTAVSDFLRAPLFGVGAWGSGIVLDFPPIMPYLYHNTPLQFLGAGGAVGVLLYLFHRAQTVCLLFGRRHSPLSLFLLLSAFALPLLSLTDEHFFHFYPAFAYAVALSLAEGRYGDGPVAEK